MSINVIVLTQTAYRYHYSVKSIAACSQARLSSLSRQNLIVRTCFTIPSIHYTYWEYCWLSKLIYFAQSEKVNAGYTPRVDSCLYCYTLFTYFLYLLRQMVGRDQSEQMSNCV